MQQQVSELRSRFDGSLIANGARPLLEVALWFGAADVVTLPSHNEGTPNVVLEALDSGRPVVGTRVGGIPDCLADPASGILVPVRDEAALAAALVDALRRSWDEASIVRAAPGSWQDSARKLYDVLESIARPSTVARVPAPKGTAAHDDAALRVGSAPSPLS